MAKISLSCLGIVAEELEKPDIAREVVLRAVATAHACAVVHSARSLGNAQGQARREVSSAVSRISNCVKRISTPIRLALDEVTLTTFREGYADSEAVANFLDGCSDILKGYPDQADAVRIMSALGVPKVKIAKSKNRPSIKGKRKKRRSVPPPTLDLINNYEAMHPSERAAVESDLQELVRRKLGNLTAFDVFTIVAQSLRASSVADIRESSRDLLNAYVAEVKEIWRRSRLSPGRARREDDTEYRSRFHIFLGLVLLNQFDPTSRLFDRLAKEELEEGLKVYFELRALGEEVVMEPLHPWLIRDEDLKIVLASDSKNSP